MYSVKNHRFLVSFWRFVFEVVWLGSGDWMNLFLVGIWCLCWLSDGLLEGNVLNQDLSAIKYVWFRGSGLWLFSVFWVVD